MPRRLAAMLVALLVLVGPAAFARPALADDRVDLLIVLAADISRSVDERKFRLQREGYAAAIVDPRVVRAMVGGPMGRIALCFVEWAGDTDQQLVMDWTHIGNAEDAEAVARRIRMRRAPSWAAPRSAPPSTSAWPSSGAARISPIGA